MKRIILSFLALTLGSFAASAQISSGVTASSATRKVTTHRYQKVGPSQWDTGVKLTLDAFIANDPMISRSVDYNYDPGFELLVGYRFNNRFSASLGGFCDDDFVFGPIASAKFDFFLQPSYSLFTELRLCYSMDEILYVGQSYYPGDYDEVFNRVYRIEYEPLYCPVTLNFGYMHKWGIFASLGIGFSMTRETGYDYNGGELNCRDRFAPSAWARIGYNLSIGKRRIVQVE